LEPIPDQWADQFSKSTIYGPAFFRLAFGEEQVACAEGILVTLFGTIKHIPKSSVQIGKPTRFLKDSAVRPTVHLSVARATRLGKSEPGNA
jgi:hypothetical protein